MHKEYTYNTIEISSVPHTLVRKGVHAWLSTLDKLIEGAKKIGLRLYPFGTYHGLHVPATRPDKYYKMCESVIGPEQFMFAAGHVNGFHIHYCLPHGTFNKKTNSLRQLFRSKYKDQMVQLYNMIVAMDPVLTNFTESSPFVDGMHIAKDSRLLIYRDMEYSANGITLRGLYSKYPIFGRLPRYVHGITDIIELTAARHREWKHIVEQEFPHYMDVFWERHALQYNWGPLRINKVGTLEYRGLDMNLPSYLIGASLLFKYVLHAVRKYGLKVVPSDVGIREPFKIEGESIYVPPYSYLANTLQFNSAVHGLSDDSIFKYSKRFFALCRKLIPNANDPGLKRIAQMLRERKTKSDLIIEQVRKSGLDLREQLPREYAMELALKGAEELEKEVESIIRRELIIDDNELG